MPCTFKRARLVRKLWNREDGPMPHHIRFATRDGGNHGECASGFKPRRDPRCQLVAAHAPAPSENSTLSAAMTPPENGGLRFRKRFGGRAGAKALNTETVTSCRLRRFLTFSMTPGLNIKGGRSEQSTSPAPAPRPRVAGCARRIHPCAHERS